MAMLPAFAAGASPKVRGAAVEGSKVTEGPKVRSAAAMRPSGSHATRERRVDAKGLFVLAEAFDVDASRANATADRLAELLKDDTVDAASLENANTQFLSLGRSSSDSSGIGHAGAEALIARLKDASLRVSYVGNLGVIRVREGVAERVALPHSVIEDYIRLKNVPESDREMLRLEAPHRFVTVRGLGMKPQVKVETLDIPARTGDRFVLANVDVLVAVPLPRFAQVVSTAKQPETAAHDLITVGSTARPSPSPAAIVIFVD